LRAIVSGAARFAADARDLLFPPHCPGCGERLDPIAAAELSDPCRRELPLPEGGLCPGCGIAAAADDGSFCPACRGRHAMDAVFFAAAYAGTAKAMVHRFKYRADFAAGRLLARLLAAKVVAAPTGRIDLVVPVPLHRRRLGGRGFNQAALLARDMGRHLGAPCALSALARSRHTRSLAGLTPHARGRELLGAFKVRVPGRIAGRRILLVDDVLTTGTTAESCCAALKEAGAAWTGVAVAARVLLPLRQGERGANAKCLTESAANR
jgi:ComF family protein